MTQSFRFEPDRCANCFQPLPDDEKHKPALFCTELCNSIAKDVRYWRKALRNGSLQDDAETRLVLHTRIAHLLGGGYNAVARTIPAGVRAFVFGRDEVCVQCGAPGQEIDHIEGDSNDPENLQLLCTDCHRAKTATHFVPATEEQNAFVDRLEQERVMPDEPSQLCDDEMFWQQVERILRPERINRIRYAATGFNPDTSVQLVDQIRALKYRRPGFDDSLEDDHSARGLDDDSGYGPDSYFAKAMARDD
ncbi:HNH endonuclease [Arthrobacter pascens]|uniref:HNH endonuclease n=1 Tax=Arthrobacter pascens TaxID=1677 RepID=UPI00196A47DE|nr:HNH endonuclease signature motif containing protein [Arthrobacter pascens]MBN3497867.1 HNH endonuclease [Arthrobacter pascens]